MQWERDCRWSDEFFDECNEWSWSTSDSPLSLSCCLCRVRAKGIQCIFKAAIISVVASEYMAILSAIEKYLKLISL